MKLLSSLSFTRRITIGLGVAVLATGVAVGAFAAHGDLPGVAPAGTATAPAGTPTPVVHGIPTTNPKHHAETTSGTCVKGETVVKTVPSGVHVNVPCQSVNHTPGAEATEVEATEAPEAEGTPGAEATEVADATPGAGHGQEHNGNGIAQKTAHAGGGE